ncbi:29911_t:CDS:2, partial [Gigaspora margarita]
NDFTNSYLNELITSDTKWGTLFGMFGFWVVAEVWRDIDWLARIVCLYPSNNSCWIDHTMGRDTGCCAQRLLDHPAIVDQIPGLPTILVCGSSTIAAKR